MPNYLHGLDLNLLHSFRVFVEERSVDGAARRLGRSQPVISERLKQLQDQLGVRLLEKHGRRLQLTPAGRDLDRRLAPLLQSLADTVEVTRAARTEPAGVLRVGVLPTVGVYVLAPRLASWLEAHEAVDVEMLTGLADDHLAALRRGEVDAVAGVGDPPHGELAVDVLSLARAVVVGRRGRVPASRAELREHDWVAFGRIGDAFFDAVGAFMEREALATRIQVAHIQTLKALVRAGLGLAILPDYTVTEPDLEAWRPRGLKIEQPIWIATRRASADVPIVGSFRDALRS